MRVLSTDPIRRTRQLWHNDPDGGVTIETQQDVTEVLEDAKMRFNASNGNWKGDLHHVARIPTSVYFSLPQEMRDDPKALKRWLDHPDQRAFRTKPGSLSR